MESSYNFKVEGPLAVPFVILACACAAMPLVFVIYLGIYAFNNPDHEAWLGKVGGGKDGSDYVLFED